MDFGAAICVVMHLLTSGLGTNDDPQPLVTPLAVPPTTRLADGLNFDLLNRRRLALHVCWQNRWWTHWRWKTGFRISPRYITLQRIAQACRRDRHCACVAPTTHIAGRPPTIFSVDNKGKLGSPPLRHSHHRRVWEDARHTHSLPEAHPQHRHSRERHSFLWSTEAHNRCPQLWVGFSCESQMVPLSSKDSWISRVGGSYWALRFAASPTRTTRRPCRPLCPEGHHGTILPVISASFSTALACMDVHSNNFLEVPRRRVHPACLTDDPACNRGATSPPWWTSDE